MLRVYEIVCFEFHSNGGGKKRGVNGRANLNRSQHRRIRFLDRILFCIHCSAFLWILPPNFLSNSRQVVSHQTANKVNFFIGQHAAEVRTLFPIRYGVLLEFAGKVLIIGMKWRSSWELHQIK